MSEYMRELRELVGHRLLLIPSASGCVFDDDGRLLLVHQIHEDLWSTPGGAIEPGELPAEACAREVREETGLAVEPIAIIGVFGGPEFETTYPSGDQMAFVSTAFHCEVVSGSLEPDGVEVDDVRYFSTEEIMRLNSPPVQRLLLPEVMAWWEDGGGEPRFRSAS